MTRQTTRVTSQYDEVAEWLRRSGYPVEWSGDQLSTCLVLEISSGPTLIGFVWGHWLFEGVLGVHACRVGATPISWLSLLSDLSATARTLGAHTIRVVVETFPDAARIQRLYRRIGFESHTCPHCHSRVVFDMSLFSPPKPKPQPLYEPPPDAIQEPPTVEIDEDTTEATERRRRQDKARRGRTTLLIPMKAQTGGGVNVS